jgi:hypothetical protein
MPWFNNKKGGRSYEWPDGTVRSTPPPSKGSGASGNAFDDAGTFQGLSATQTSLHQDEASARERKDWQRAIEIKHMLNNADSRVHWESKAQEALQEYASDPAFAQKMHDICMANAAQAPNK